MLRAGPVECKVLGMIFDKNGLVRTPELGDTLSDGWETEHSAG
ncbi:hypothetical protein O9H85_05160 [Paenibacillus filicis]|uniref:Uncharacterized protein n=1 Tax=Paenibacillus gyeongsangnamensis TaxID=3388067 RepID=A0ABT4Q4K9_9BACL|nr:hypothetical protein [Paenibacillus filicis]